MCCAFPTSSSYTPHVPLFDSIKTLFIFFLSRFPTPSSPVPSRASAGWQEGLHLDFSLFDTDKHWQLGRILGFREGKASHHRTLACHGVKTDFHFAAMLKWHRMQDVTFLLSHWTTLRELLGGDKGIITNEKVTWKLHSHHWCGYRCPLAIQGCLLWEEAGYPHSSGSGKRRIKARGKRGSVGGS